ncbi:MAG: hypothetical protein ACOY0T_12725 [Myxococcota bacterium]
MNPVAEMLPRLLEMGGLGVFIWFCIRGLQQQITALKATADVQKDTLVAQCKTLDAMERRVAEAEKIGALYRGLIEQLPRDLDNYKAIIHRLKDQVIEQLEAAVQRKDDELAELTRSRLDEIERQEKVLDELPRLREDLMSTFQALEGRLSVLDLFQPGTPLRGLLHQLESAIDGAKTPAIETSGVSLLTGDRRRSVKAIAASLPADQTEVVVQIPEVDVTCTEVRVSPENSVRAVLQSPFELLIRRRDFSDCRCLEVDVQLVQH